MRRRRTVVKRLLPCLFVPFVAGCFGGEDGSLQIDADEVYRVDFVGELLAAETSQWQLSQRDPDRQPVAATSGGPDSELLVGPATLRLDGGTIVKVSPQTPGGNLCPLLDLFNQPPDPPPGLEPTQACLVIGMYQPGTTTAAWFATEVVDRRGNGGFAVDASFQDGQALLRAGWGAFFAVYVRPDVDVGCGMRFDDVLAAPTAGYTVTVRPDLEVSTIECHPTD